MSGSTAIDPWANLCQLCATTTSTEDNEFSTGTLPTEMGKLTALRGLEIGKFFVVGANGVVQLVYRLTFVDCVP